MPTYVDAMPSPVGLLTLAADDHGLTHIRFEQERHPIQDDHDWVPAPERFVEVRRQL